MGFGGVGIYFGVNAAKRNLASLIIITGMSGAIFILGLIFLDVQLLIISGVFVAGNIVIFNVPKLKYQFL
jgi:hypothetical protein